MSGLAGAVVEGFLLGAGLIIAIGAQNAFVLRQGLMRRHVFAVATACALSDIVLIAAGVAGLGSLVRAHPKVLAVVTLAGAIFLIAYGLLAFRRALAPGRLQAAIDRSGSLGATLAACLALTFLNPHVYLDTVAILGSAIAATAHDDRLSFTVGAMLASTAWFLFLGALGSLVLRRFGAPVARAVDLISGTIMLIVATVTGRPSALPSRVAIFRPASL